MSIKEKARNNVNGHLLSEEYEHLIGSLPCGICMFAIDELFTIIYANELYYKLFGYTRQEAWPAGFTSLGFALAPWDFKALKENIEEKLSKQVWSFELELRVIHRSGTMLWMLGRFAYNLDEPGHITCVQIDIEARRQMEERLKLSVQEAWTAFHLTKTYINVYHITSRTLIQPQGAADLFGLPVIVENAPYSIVASGMIADESIEDYLNFFESMINGVSTGSSISRKRKKDGSYGWYSEKYALIYDKGGIAERGVIAYEDVTEQHEKEIAFQKWSQNFEALKPECIGYYEYNLTRNIFEKASGKLYCAIPKDILSFSESVVYIGEHFVVKEDREKYYRIFDRDKLLIRFYDQIYEEICLEHRRINENGKILWAEASVQLIEDPYTDDIKAFILIKDIDKRKKKELLFKSRMELDPLTELLNRGTMIARIREVLQTNSTGRHALIMLDIDHLKYFNDNYGHQFGDMVLRDIGDSLKHSLRKYDFCGRIGGDEFMIFLNDLPECNSMEQRFQKLCDTVSKVYPDKGVVSGSLGVAFYPDDGRSFEELYDKADKALYKAKKMGRRRYMVYHCSMEE